MWPHDFDTHLETMFWLISAKLPVIIWLLESLLLPHFFWKLPYTKISIKLKPDSFYPVCGFNKLYLNSVRLPHCCVGQNNFRELVLTVPTKLCAWSFYLCQSCVSVFWLFGGKEKTTVRCMLIIIFIHQRGGKAVPDFSVQSLLARIVLQSEKIQICTSWHECNCDKWTNTENMYHIFQWTKSTLVG